MFANYSGGVFADNSCGTTLNHAMLAVGWNWANGQKYIIVKNSWGTGWGEEGYMRIVVTDGEGYCGINKAPYIPFGHKI